MGHSAAMAIPTSPGSTGRRGVMEGARPRRLPVLIALVMGAFVVVEAVLLGLGVLVTRVLAHSSLHRAESAFEQDVVERSPHPVVEPRDRLRHGAGRDQDRHRADGRRLPAPGLAGARSPAAGLPRAGGRRRDRAVRPDVAGDRSAAARPSRTWTAPRRRRASRPGTPRRPSRSGAASRSAWRARTPATRSGCSAGSSPSRCRRSCWPAGSIAGCTGRPTSRRPSSSPCSGCCCSGRSCCHGKAPAPGFGPMHGTLERPVRDGDSRRGPGRRGWVG